MRLFEAIRRRKATTASVATIAALAIGVTTMAFLYEGIETADVDLNDGGVWVTKPTGLLLGHLNHPAQVIDGGLRTSSTEFDVLQRDETVLMLDASGSSLTPVNPVTMALEAPLILPPESSVSLGGPNLTVLDRETGELWAGPSSNAAGLQLDPDEPLAELGGAGAAVADAAGNVHALSTSAGKLLEFDRDENGALPVEPTSTDFPEVEEGARLTLTTVGDQAVVFDASSGTVHLPGGRAVELADASGGVVQPTGPAASDVLIATKTSLIRQPLDGGEATVVQAGGAEPGTPAAPVFLNGCAYAAWSGSGAFVRDCSGDANDVDDQIDGLAANAELRFRVNRDVVVLNDVSTGVVFLVNQDMKKVDNWDDIAPPPEQSDSDEEEDSTEDELQVLLPDRSEENTPPTAEDDDFGVRAGRTVVLPVLDNDLDPDGDMLTAKLEGSQPGVGEVQRILNGAALQVVVSPDASGTASFTYTVDDGRGGSDSATVRLKVSGDGENSPPKQKRVTDVLVELGASVSHNVLPDFIDPDGDDLYVVGASSGTDDQVQYRPDGQLTFTSIDQNTGPKEVTVVVSDGRTETEGTVRFQVRDPGSLAPVTNGDTVVTTVDERVTVAPMDNDLSPSGAPLRLAKVTETPGATIQPDYTTGTFDFTSSTPGDYYVQYLVSDGPKTAEGLVRVTVLPVTDSDDPPIAVRDTAQLPNGGTTLVNVLANDTDPNGGILAVQSVQVPAEAGVSVEVLEHEILRITDRGLNDPLTITYTVSNGAASARGEVFITPIAAPDRLLPPNAEDDEVTVRVNDIVTIPVLANDTHPNGDTLTLSPTLIEPLVDPADGSIFVAGDTVRFKAGPEPKTVYATYEAVDSQGQKDAGYITIRIVGPDDGTNAPPRPQDVTIRALQGTTVRIPIPLDGIDPDGDSVELVGQSSAPGKGRITEVGEAWLVYEAYPDASGTDTFTYTVRDRLGATATASVLVGIIPASESNQPPYAVKDAISARPGRTVAVDVMENDNDPDGDPIAIRSEGLTVPDGVTASVEGGRVLVTAPDTAGDYTLQYTIVDRWGATATGTLLMQVSPDAPLASPIARDDQVPVADMLDRETVDVNVKENDDDPDGTIDGLTVTSADPAATPLSNGNLQITLLPTSQIITYTVTDQDGLTASAFVNVPGSDTLPPVLRPGIEPLVVNDGQTVDVELSDYVLVGEGKSVRITEADTVRAANSNGDELLVDENTLRYTPKPRYDGPDALSFEVTDGTGPDDPEGRTATLVIPITVVSDYNTPPTFKGAAVTVAAGEDEQAIDLRSAAEDPDEGELEALTFAIVGDAPAGVSVRLDGSTLVARADADAPLNPSTLDVEVSDGVNPPVRGAVQISVLATTRTPPSATDDVVPQANQGQTVSVPVLDNDFNPFPDTPLTITEVAIETGTGNADFSGSTVSVTPAADYVGTMIVRYGIIDATGDPSRRADGRILLTVQGRPDAPATPTVTSIQDRTVVLNWAPPVNNGAEITSYTVTSPQGYTKSCASTTCTLDGLTNDVEYTFTVTATNSVGISDPSPSSAVARPDARPDQPQPPTLKFGDKSLEVSWVTPPTPGSAVQSFNLEISPAPARGAPSRYGVTGNSIVWEGLENGTAYQVRVQAVNKAPEPSDFSSFSATEIPAGKPEAPSQPSTTRLDPVGNQSQINVAWGKPSGNGDDNLKYTLTILRGGSPVDTLPGLTSTDQTVRLDTSESDYSFSVTATNKAGEGAPSAASAPRRSFTPPGAAGPATITSEGDGSVTFDRGASADGNGATQGELIYQYSLNGSGWTAIPGNAQTYQIAGLQNGTSYSVRVRATTPLDGTNYEGPASGDSNTGVPFGPLAQPSVSASGNAKSVTLSWSAPAGNGRPITSIEVYIDGNLSSNAGNGTVTVGDAYSESHSIRVVVKDSAGQTSSNETRASSKDAPPKGAFLSSWKSCDGTGLTNGPPCVRMKITVENFLGQSSVFCEWTGGEYLSTTIPVDGNGNGSKELNWYTQDTGAYSLENQASRMNCEGTPMKVRR
ncbi:Ig-like domain-containing protein [Herbiconiux sp. CPCC 205716]|uniref:Ig-like domain-containing protein n=1 Tax=Herbiconiux gentiana TaxID=2970912 RepID=A0ABT2GL14_9MICO|nr:Ig-like domain-containing protein [Herbiconiux gentiana]MCS5715995.1 Ig-like domain-containing protein [Herbiconiux gentiana]